MDEWEEIEIDGTPVQTAYVKGGLMVVYELDEDFSAWPDRYEIWHRPSREPLLRVEATLERTMAIADDLSAIADWSSIASVDGPTIEARVSAFMAGYPGEALADHGIYRDIESIIPYGDSPLH